MGFFDPTTFAGKPRRNSIPHCGRCKLFQQCKSPRMQPTGKGRRKVLFVAEAPGETEDARGVQLVGKAGKCLRGLLHDIGVELEDCWKTNAVVCRPPDNRMEDYYIECCRPNLLETVARLKPNVIIVLGDSALAGLLHGDWSGSIGPLGRWVGFRIPSVLHNAWLCPTYHPSYLLRMNEDELLASLIKSHLRAAFELETVKPTPLDHKVLEDSIELIEDPQESRKRIQALANRSGVMAFDYECTGLKPERVDQRILTCSFSLGGNENIACKIDESCHQSLSAVLRNPKLKKVAANMKFEERWTRRKLGHGVAGWYWDTMLMAHLLDNRKGICGLDFQAYVQFGIGNYCSGLDRYMANDGEAGANSLNHLGEISPLLYNGLDSLIEYKLMERQRSLSGF